MRNDGYTLLELLACMAILSIVFLLCVPYFFNAEPTRYLFITNYLLKQAECMNLNAYQSMEDMQNVWHNHAIEFNPLGHVNQAQTVTIENHGHFSEIVIELAGGRLVEK